MTLDIKIVNGLIIDGSGNPAYFADVGIVGDQIVVIGKLDGAISSETIDATGKIVAPGFIDMHTHSDLAVLFDPHTNSKIFDGVTTEVVGNCGIGVAPVSEANRKLLIDYLGTRMIGNLPVTIELHWSSMAEYLDYVRQHPPALNVVALLAQGPVRIAVMGFGKDTPSDTQMAEMKALVKAGMAEGAVGFSSGLIYMPGEFSSTDELAELSKEIKPYQGFYVTHIRNESEGVFDALEEALTIGKKAGVPVHVSHLKVAGQSVWGRSPELLSRIDAANQAGIETTFDVYPYTSGMTGLTACMPPWAFEGGVEKLLTRLADAETRDKIIADVENGIPGWQNLLKAAGGWENITITTVNSQTKKNLEGKTIQQIADMEGKRPVHGSVRPVDRRKRKSFDCASADGGRRFDQYSEASHGNGRIRRDERIDRGNYVIRYAPPSCVRHQSKGVGAIFEGEKSPEIGRGREENGLYACMAFGAAETRAAKGRVLCRRGRVRPGYRYGTIPHIVIPSTIRAGLTLLS